MFAGVGGVGSGMALSAEVSEGEMPCISDILRIVQFVICANRENLGNYIT